MADERAIAAVLAEHRRNDVTEGCNDDVRRTRIKCDGDGCGYYHVAAKWRKAVAHHEAHVAAAIAAIPGDDAARALWKAERAVYLLRMNTHRGEDYRDAIEDADKVIRELIIAADLSAAHAAAEPEAGR